MGNLYPSSMTGILTDTGQYHLRNHIVRPLHPVQKLNIVHEAFHSWNSYLVQG